MDEKKPPQSDVEYEDQMNDLDDLDPVSRMDYMRSVVPPPKPKRMWPRIVFTVIFACLIIAAAAFSYEHFHLNRHNGAKHTSSDSAVTRSSSQSAAQASQTLAYDSNGNDLNLTFDYPKNWSVTPPTDENPADQPITVTSPSAAVLLSGAQKTVRVSVFIRPGSSTLSELSSGNATAALPSTQFSYSQPTPTQDKFPYISYISLTGGTTNGGAFQEVVVSGSQQLAQGVSVTTSTITADPLITASFYSCSNSNCQSETPLAITTQEWQQDSIFQQAFQLIESLEFN